MLKKILSLILLTVLVLTSFVIPAYADSAIGNIGTEEMEPIENDRVPLKDSYTEDEIRALLSGDHNFDLPEEGIKFGSENFPLAVDENVASPDAVDILGDDYYITVLSSGKILVAPNSTYITTTNYVESEAYMWVFEEVDLLTYAIRNKLNPNTCLAASPSSSGNSAVVKKTYSATDPTCHWSMSMSSNGNYIQSEAVGTNAYGQYLYLSGNQFVLSSSNLTYIGLVDVDWWIPCTAISLGDYICVTKDATKTFSISTTPSNANNLGSLYMTYTVANTSICTVDGRSKKLTGKALGKTTLTVKQNMTGVTCTVDVYVGYPARVKAYYDNAFETLCSRYSGYNNNPITQIEEWFEEVAAKYRNDLNINLSLVSIAEEASYPEVEECLGDDPDDPCGCSADNQCQNGVNALHHKNIYNILSNVPETGSDSDLVVFFTGHNICYPFIVGSELGHDEGDTWGMSSFDDSSCVIVTNINDYSDVYFGDNTQREEFLVSAIAHEIGHLFQNPGVTLHHKNKQLNGMNETCTYGDLKTTFNAYKDIYICDYCTNIIKSNADRYK